MPGSCPVVDKDLRLAVAAVGRVDLAAAIAERVGNIEETILRK